MSAPVPLDLGYITGPRGLQGPPPTAEDIIDAISDNLNDETLAAEDRIADPTPTEGSMKLITSGAVHEALQAIRDEVSEKQDVVELEEPTTLDPPTLNTKLYYSNGAATENTLAIVLPADAMQGDSFWLEFLSTGNADSKAVVSSFGVEDGGILLTKGSLSNNAYCTRISAVYSFGAWAAEIETYSIAAGVSAVIPERPTGTIVYSGANRAYFNSLQSPSISKTVTVGQQKLVLASKLKPTGSAYTFGNMYGLTFAGWNTARNGSGTTYKNGATVTIAQQGATLTLYPMYTPKSASVTQSKTTVSLTNTSSTTKNLAASPGVTGYKELTLKVKVYGYIYCRNGGISANIKVNGTTLVSRTDKGEASATSGWITLTRSSSSAAFKVPVQCNSTRNGGSNDKMADFTIKVAAIRIE